MCENLLSKRTSLYTINPCIVTCSCFRPLLALLNKYFPIVPSAVSLTTRDVQQAGEVKKALEMSVAVIAILQLQVVCITITYDGQQHTVSRNAIRDIFNAQIFISTIECSKTILVLNVYMQLRSAISNKQSLHKASSLNSNSSSSLVV